MVLPPTYAYCDVAVVKPFRPVLKYKLWTYIQNTKPAYSRHFVTIPTYEVPTQIKDLPLTWLIIFQNLRSLYLIAAAASEPEANERGSSLISRGLHYRPLQKREGTGASFLY